MAEKEKPTIYNLALHEGFWPSSDLFVRRVPGGWIYYDVDHNVNNYGNVFVPFNNEFFGRESE